MPFARLSLALALALAAGRAAADDGWTIHFQATGVEQWHYAFPSPYAGPNSLEGTTTEDEHTWTATLFLGRALWPGAAIFYNPEETQGNGLSGTEGVAAFPNGEATRAGSATPLYDTARLYLQQVIPLTGETQPQDDDDNTLAGPVATRRLTFYLGRYAVTDFFETNAYSDDPRTQFLNWALMYDGAYDYPADTKGYTDGFTATLTYPSFTLSYGIFMEPLYANGLKLDPHFDRAYGQILEWDQKYTWGGWAGNLRSFVYLNRADMGSYSEAIADPAADLNIELTRAYRSKYGAGLSWDQEIAPDLGAFLRASWDDGHTESWAFSEIDQSASAGLSADGKAWGRAGDTFGLAGIVDGLSPAHREYLADGGIGFIIGDGRLDYGPEEILETYYSWKVCRWLWLSPDYQYVEHPAYNRDRGGVAIYAVRAHLHF
ncbi:MAG TPA: carbohydrate porin [Opitutaceae bacterium]|nr:carbohydrate porin [Opitutaceae bacterium]